MCVQRAGGDGVKSSTAIGALEGGLWCPMSRTEGSSIGHQLRWGDVTCDVLPDATVLFYFYFYLALGQTGRLVVDTPRRWSRSTTVYSQLYSLAWSSLATCQKQWLTAHVSRDRHSTGRGHSATWNASGRTCCQGRSLNLIDVVNNICK